MEECCATNAGIEVRIFLGRLVANWPVAQLAEYPAFNRGVVSSMLTGPTEWMNSSMAERPVVNGGI